MTKPTAPRSGVDEAHRTRTATASRRRRRLRRGVAPSSPVFAVDVAGTLADLTRRAR